MKVIRIIGCAILNLKKKTLIRDFTYLYNLSMSDVL